MTHVYYGSGKGKTTAAIGLAVRAAGCGKRVLICRFLKNSDSGELNVLKNTENIELLEFADTNGFVFEMSACERESVRCAQCECFERASESILCGDYDMAVLDEVLWLCELGMISEDALCGLVKGFGKEHELVLTGGKAGNKLLALADYATHMEKIAHPYDSGAAPRRGVEF